MRAILLIASVGSLILPAMAQERQSKTAEAPPRIVIKSAILQRRSPVPIHVAPKAGARRGGRTNVFRIFGESDRFVCATGFGSDLDATVAMLMTNREGRSLARNLTLVTTPGAPASVFAGCGESKTTSPRADSKSAAPDGNPLLDAGMGLSLTPSLNPDGSIVVAVRSTVDKVVRKSVVPRVGEIPKTNSTVSEASVQVRDGEVVVVKGVIEPSKKKSMVLASPKNAEEAGSRSREFPAGCEFIFVLQPTVVGGQ